LREKQKAKRLYNLREEQFRRYYDEAKKKQGNTSDYLMEFLERRLDNVVYRAGFAKTRRMARQMVGHRFFEVNGQIVNIPSFRVSVGDQVVLREIKQKKGIATEAKDRVVKHVAPKWISMDSALLSAKITSAPDANDMEKLFEPKMIIELYSR
jgi:small subunit ribosomal protein S4